PPPPGPNLSQAYPLIDQLVANRKISRDFGNLLKSQVGAAQGYIDKGKNAAAVAYLKVVVLELDLLVQLRQGKAADVSPLRDLLTEGITQLNTPAVAQALELYRKQHGHHSCHSRQSFRIHRFR